MEPKTLMKKGHIAKTTNKDIENVLEWAYEELERIFEKCENDLYENYKEPHRTIGELFGVGQIEETIYVIQKWRWYKSDHMYFRVLCAARQHVTTCCSEYKNICKDTLDDLEVVEERLTIVYESYRKDNR